MKRLLLVIAICIFAFACSEESDDAESLKLDHEESYCDPSSGDYNLNRCCNPRFKLCEQDECYETCSDAMLANGCSTRESEKACQPE